MKDVLDMRLFVAITIDEEIKQNILLIQQAIQKFQPDIKLVQEENIHLTLRFLGETPEEKLKSIEKVLCSVQEYPSFEMVIRKLGAFPSLKNPRVVWVGCENASENIEKIYLSIENELRKLQFPSEERAHLSHITLGRNKSRGYNSLNELAEKYTDKILGKQVVKKITLFQSNLTPRGPIYTNIRDFNLRG